LSVLATGPLRGAPAQSGRVAPTPRPTAATPEADPPNRPGAVAGSDGEYKLVFPNVYKGRRYFSADADRGLMDRTRRSRLDNFVERLNEAGAQGYGLTSFVADYPFVALVRAGGGRHEFALFETSSPFAFHVGLQFREKYAESAGQGFRLAEHSLLSAACEKVDPENSLSNENCLYRHLFLLKRESRIVRPAQFRVARSVPVRGVKPALELTADVREALAEGLHPTRALSAFEVLLEREAGGGRPAKDRPDVQVVRSSSFWHRDNLEEHVNKLARQGYRLALVNRGIALMYRPGVEAAPVTYVWLKAKDKSFTKRLAQLQQSGAVYLTTYPDEEGGETGLIFETGGTEGARRREYKVLEFDFQVVENSGPKDGAGGTIHIDLAPSSKETLKALNRSAAEGFSVRDLFTGNKLSVLLERPL